MRWCVLYARSRMSVLPVLVLGIGAILSATADILSDNGFSLATVILLGAISVIAAAPGLEGQDPDLDRTAAIAWAPRRAAHLLLLAVLVTGTLLLLNGFGDVPVQRSVIVRDTLGQIGLLGLGSALFGASFGWALPFLFLVSLLFPGVSQTPVLGWLTQPAGSSSAAWTATVAVIAGFSAYTLAGTGIRRHR